jgi:8-oxo-dGTP pyrophosphatase MutT (NUDIX family)
MSERSDLPEQAAAIAFRRGSGGVEVCLIRRKGAEAWGIPKGLVDPGDTCEETALNEAWEEAGLKGRLIGESIGTYDYRKWGRTFTVAVYLLEVLEQQPAWLESRFRERSWVSFEGAVAILTGHPVRPLLDRARSAMFPGGPSARSPPCGPRHSSARHRLA